MIQVFAKTQNNDEGLQESNCLLKRTTRPRKVFSKKIRTVAPAGCGVVP